MKLNRFKKFETFWFWKYETSLISEKNIETIYLKLLISIAEKIAMSVIETITDNEAITDADSIIDEIETLLSNEKNAVDEFADVIWERKFNEKNSIFMMNWFNIDADCQKFENRAMMKIRVMFERLLICVFFFSFFFNQRKLFLYFFRIVFFIFFFFFAQTVAQIAVALFFYNNNISFKNQIFFVLSLYIFCIRHTMFHLKIIHSCFHRKKTYFELISSFFFSWKSLFSIFFSVVSVFLFRFLSSFWCLSSLWCLKFSIVRCFFFVFEFYDFDRKHSNLMFSHVVVFSKREFVVVFVFRERCFTLIFFYFCSLRRFFFRCYLKNVFNSIINVKIWNMCSKELIMNKKK